MRWRRQEKRKPDLFHSFSVIIFSHRDIHKYRDIYINIYLYLCIRTYHMPHQTSLLPRLPSTSCRESIYRELYIHSSDPVVASFLHWYVRTTFWDPIAKSKLNSSSLSLSLFSLSHLSFSLFNLIKRSFVVTPSLHPLLFSYLQKKKQEKKKDTFFFGLLYRNCVRIYALFPVSWSGSSSNWESETFFLSGSDSVRYIIIPICSSFFY